MPKASDIRNSIFEADSWLGSFVSLMRWTLPDKPAGWRDSAHPFEGTDELWSAALSGRRPIHTNVSLTEVSLVEWIPQNPGLFIHERIAQGRMDAAQPISRETVAGREVDVFGPRFKTSLWKSGYGCVRLRPLERRDSDLWLLAVTSTEHAHEGFVVGLDNQQYASVIDQVRAEGSVRCNIEGALHLIPQKFPTAFLGREGGPHVFLRVHDLKTHRGEPPPVSISVAMGFATPSDYADSWGYHPPSPSPFAVCLASFASSNAHGSGEAAEWMTNEYIPRYDGRIVTDFDDLYPHNGASLSLNRLMSGAIGAVELNELEALLGREQFARISFGRFRHGGETVTTVRNFFMRDQYNVEQGVGVGPNASGHVHNMLQGPMEGGIDYAQLALELARALRGVSSGETTVSPEVLVALAEAKALAELEPHSDDDRENRMVDALRRAGSKGLEFAEAVGASLTAAAILWSIEGGPFV